MNSDGTVNVSIKNKNGVNITRDYTGKEAEGLLIGGAF